MGNQNVDFCHRLIHRRYDKSWGSVVMVLAGVCYRQPKRATLPKSNPDNNCWALCWSSVLPTRWCLPAHCQDMQGLPWTGWYSCIHVACQMAFRCSGYTCLPAGPCSLHQLSDSDGSAGGMGEHLSVQDWQLRDVHGCRGWRGITLHETN